MPTCPSGGRSTSALGMAAASGSAEAGGTMRSRPGMATSAGRRSSCGRMVSPATRHSPRPGALSPYHERRHSRATASGNGTPSLIQSSSATKPLASALCRVEPGETGEFALGKKRVEQKKQPLNDLGRQGCRDCSGRRQTIAEKAEEVRLGHALGVEIPRRRQQYEPGKPPLPAQRQRQRQQAAHAIAEDCERFSRRSRRENKGAVETVDTARQIEPGFAGTGTAPIDDQRA